MDRGVGRRAMVLAPVVGGVVGGLAAGVVVGVLAVRPGAGLLAAVLGVLVVAGVSGGLHLDGLADFADALGSRRDRETMLRIMKQSDIGPFGVLSLVGVLLVDVAALAVCIEAGFGWQAILIAVVASRLTLVWTCRSGVPSARPDGLGGVVAGTVPTWTAALVSAVVTAGAVVAFGWAAGVAVLLAIGVALAVTRRARKLLGGVTGDVLGAAVELALPISLLTLALSS
ncbi:adenosylcobinamide-GDP ribazoletransferase [Kribbella sandramycini]|uniref:Adenosylcobinamide-GDP ribazoletransferase n=1 Tax=Kribbella sandramycini TaxID=60450 RepID=A0A841SG79_9ACTN|nr:adenosylcobinamide-GDP ribazoletransferase [Kribbella sandramycini]